MDELVSPPPILPPQGGGEVVAWSGMTFKRGRGALEVGEI